MATGLTGAVIFQISSVIVRVLFPTLSAMKEHQDRMGRVWLKACSAIAIAAWPLMAGAIALASDLIPEVFGTTWEPSVVPFQMLCALMAVQAVATTAGSVLMAFGKTGLIVRISTVNTIAGAAALYGGSFYGLNGVAAACAVVGIATQLVFIRCAAQAASMRFAEVVIELRVWAVASVATGFGMGLLHVALAGLTPVQRLVACIVAGVALYPLCLWVFARKRTLALVAEVGQRLRKP
jgi:PST family polysaccharide transporter